MSGKDTGEAVYTIWRSRRSIPTAVEISPDHLKDDQLSLSKRLSRVLSGFAGPHSHSATPFEEDGEKKEVAYQIPRSPIECSTGTNRFLQAVERIKSSVNYTSTVNSFTPYGFYNGRPIIGECTKVDGGIYVGAVPHEAIVVDKKYGLLECLDAELMNRISHPKQSDLSIEERVVSEALRLTQETLRYDHDAVDSLISREQLEPDQKVALDVFIKERIGTARHQVLLAGYLLEKLREKHILSGCICIDGQTSSDGIEDERLIYTSLDGRLLIFCPGIV